MKSVSYVQFLIKFYILIKNFPSQSFTEYVPTLWPIKKNALSFDYYKAQCIIII